ncbi:MAG: hypothetical protein ACE5O2_04010 [Armatimonadota bacterium]
MNTPSSAESHGCGGGLRIGLLAVLALAAVIGAGAGAFAQTQPVYFHPHGQLAVMRELDVRLRVTGTSTDGLTLLRVDILRPGLGAESGHGVKFFVDGRLTLKDTNVRTDSYGFQWKITDPAQLNRSHYLVVNVCDHNDHIGVATLRFRPGQRLGLVPDGGESQPVPASRGDFVEHAKAVACCGDGMWPDRADATTTTWVQRDI